MRSALAAAARATAPGGGKAGPGGGGGDEVGDAASEVAITFLFIQAPHNTGRGLNDHNDATIKAARKHVQAVGLSPVCPLDVTCLPDDL